MWLPCAEQLNGKRVVFKDSCSVCVASSRALSNGPRDDVDFVHPCCWRVIRKIATAAAAAAAAAATTASTAAAATTATSASAPPLLLPCSQLVELATVAVVLPVAARSLLGSVYNVYICVLVE